MNFKNMKTYNPHSLLLNLSNKVNLKRSDKYTTLSKLSIYYTEKNIKTSHTKPTKLKYQLEHGMKCLN